MGRGRSQMAGPSSCAVCQPWQPTHPLMHASPPVRAVAGVQAARAAGMRVIGVLTSLPRAQLEAAAPDAIFSATADVSLEAVTTLEWRDVQLSAAAAGAAP